VESKAVAAKVEWLLKWGGVRLEKMVREKGSKTRLITHTECHSMDLHDYMMENSNGLDLEWISILSEN
jgi:hypothetical protein